MWLYGQFTPRNISTIRQISDLYLFMANWNYWIIFTEQEDIDFTGHNTFTTPDVHILNIQVQGSPTKSGFQPNLIKLSLEPLRSPENKEPGPNSRFTYFTKLGPTGFKVRSLFLFTWARLKYSWKSGERLDHPEAIQDVLPCTSTQRIRRINLHSKSPTFYIWTQRALNPNGFFLFKNWLRLRKSTSHLEASKDIIMYLDVPRYQSFSPKLSSSRKQLFPFMSRFSHQPFNG